MSEELEVIHQGDEIEINVHNGVSGGWIRFPITKASELIAKLLEIRTQDLRERNIKLDQDAKELQQGIKDRKQFDRANMEGNLTAGLRDKEW